MCLEMLYTIFIFSYLANANSSCPVEYRPLRTAKHSRTVNYYINIETQVLHRQWINRLLGHRLSARGKRHGGIQIC